MEHFYDRDERDINQSCVYRRKEKRVNKQMYSN